MEPYPIILADPPWPYRSRCPHKKTRFGGGAGGHYPTMPVERICELDVKALAARNAVCLVWTTGPHIESAYRVLRAWGFKPIKPVLVWVKTTTTGKLFRGSGYYTQSNTEYLVLGTRGKVWRAERGQGSGICDVVMAPHPRELRPHPRTGRMMSFIRHSAKPAIFRDLIVQLFGDLPRLELFAREAASGWAALGNQLEGGAVELVPGASLLEQPGIGPVDRPGRIARVGSSLPTARRLAAPAQLPLFADWSIEADHLEEAAV